MLALKSAKNKQKCMCISVCVNYTNLPRYINQRQGASRIEAESQD